MICSAIVPIAGHGTSYNIGISPGYFEIFVEFRARLDRMLEKTAPALQA